MQSWFVFTVKVCEYITWFHATIFPTILHWFLVTLIECNAICFFDVFLTQNCPFSMQHFKEFLAERFHNIKHNYWKYDWYLFVCFNLGQGHILPKTGTVLPPKENILFVTLLQKVELFLPQPERMKTASHLEIASAVFFFISSQCGAAIAPHWIDLCTRILGEIMVVTNHAQITADLVYWLSRQFCQSKLQHSF